jgi:HEAT repeat protein
MKTRPLFLDINKDHLLLSALNDKSPVMRRAAMAALIRHQIISSRAQEFAQSMLSDRSKAVRERAQFILSRCAQIG